MNAFRHLLLKTHDAGFVISRGGEEAKVYRGNRSEVAVEFLSEKQPIKQSLRQRVWMTRFLFFCNNILEGNGSPLFVAMEA